ncbi:hypothetical protein [Xanthobacter autotrophicus]|uniref:hypothetical protein n=1 Tax=Xanthobacter autotrophicus TaxID=280 RepID=UPI003727DF01
MSSLLRAKLVALAVAAAAATGAASTGHAAAIGTGALALAPGQAASVTDVGYWHRGRYYNGPYRGYGGPYRGGCWNCGGGNGAAVGAGVALGILGAAAIAGAASAPPPPVYYEEEPEVYYQPAPRVYLEPAPQPRSCWVATGPGGGGYWSPC